MKIQNTKSGFTLTEVMVGSFIGIMIMGAAMTTLIHCYHGVRQGMAEYGLVTAIRLAREGINRGMGVQGGLTDAFWDSIGTSAASNGMRQVTYNVETNMWYTTNVSDNLWCIIEPGKGIKHGTRPPGQAKTDYFSILDDKFTLTALDVARNVATEGVFTETDFSVAISLAGRQFSRNHKLSTRILNKEQ